MADEKSNKLQDGIAYFEQILQMMPEDRSTLEFLCIAYEQTGNREKYGQTVVSLAKVLVKERDFASAQKLLESIETHAEPEIKAVALKIRAMLSPGGADAAKATGGGEAEGAASTNSADHATAIAAELELAKWMESNHVIDGELYTRICDHLHGLASARGEFLISALAVLESENPAVSESAVAVIADKSRVPPIALESFEQIEEFVKDIPELLVRVRGVVPFGKISNDTLVALANPMDENLKMEIVSHLGGKCHFFFVPTLSLKIVLGRLFPETEK